MKTTTFGRIKVEEGTITVFSPGQGTVTLSITPDELMMFLVEVHNGLAEGRKRELIELQKRELEKERKR